MVVSRLKSVFDGIPASELLKRRKITQPSFMVPMLATLTDSYFSEKGWLYEHKFDGVRCLAFKRKGKVRLISRNNKLMNAEYPEIVEALAKQAADNFIIDGEIVALNAKGVSDFQLLQGRMNLKARGKVIAQERTVKVRLCIFDLMYVEGYTICSIPLLLRKKILKKLLRFNKLLVFSKHKTDDGISYFKYACSHGWEGLIVKRADSEYVHARSANWLKFKCVMEQELVIGGYTTPKGSRSYFGALLVGYYSHGKLMYAGKVGTGYSQAVLEMLGEKLQKLVIKRCPFSNYDESSQGVYWVSPQLVGEFGFAQWTRAGKLRVGRFKGLRKDKSAKQVVKEIPKAISIKHT
jgi:DNA ligase D-like protein (predicted ligase)